MGKAAGTIVCKPEDVQPIVIGLLKNDYQVLINPKTYDDKIVIKYCYYPDTGHRGQANFIAIDRDEEYLVRNFRKYQEGDED